MINLLVALILMCGSFGATLSKFQKENVGRKSREHTEPLKLD